MQPKEYDRTLYKKGNDTRPNQEDKPVKFMISHGIASVVQSQSGAASGMPSLAIAIPGTTAVLSVQSPKKGVTAQPIMAVIPAEIPATMNLYLDGKIRQWHSRGDGKGVVFLADAKTEDQARARVEMLPLAKQQLMDHRYIPVGPLMSPRPSMGPRALQ